MKRRAFSPRSYVSQENPDGILPPEALSSKAEFLDGSELGAALVTFVANKPIDLVHGRYSESMPAVIKVGDGRLTLQSAYVPLGNPATEATMVAHDLGHFLAAPDEVLAHLNLGLQVNDRLGTCPWVVPPRTLESLRGEEIRVFAFQRALVEHLAPEAQKSANLLRMAELTAMFVGWSKAEFKAACDATKITADEALAELDRKLTLVKAL